MKMTLYAMAVAIVITGCSPKIVQSCTDSRDSVRIEYRERIVMDTAYVEIPYIKEVNVTRDTMSHLENDYAKSDAVVSGGTLSHSLETKSVTVQAPVYVTVRDTIIVRGKADTIIEEKIVEVEKPLNGWVKFWRNFGYISALALILMAVVKIVSNRTKILTSIKKLLSL